jgi:hypothetical protein
MPILTSASTPSRMVGTWPNSIRYPNSATNRVRRPVRTSDKVDPGEASA